MRDLSERELDPALRRLADELFGQSAVYVEVLHHLSRAVQAPRRYTFMDTNEFERRAESSGPRWINQVYWKEMLMRAHWAGSTSACRHHRWLHGALTAAQSPNFLTFAASLRGLVEACADSYTSLSAIALTLGENYTKIRKAIAGCLDSLHVSQEIEDELIHFQFAGEHKAANLPSVYHSKKTRDYIQNIAGGEQDVISLYRSLCGLTHPADTSLSWLVDRPDPSSVAFPGLGDWNAIKELCGQYRLAIGIVLQRGVNSDIILLKTLNEFQWPLVRTSYIDTLRLPETPAWTRICRAIAEGGPAQGSQS